MIGQEQLVVVADLFVLTTVLHGIFGIKVDEVEHVPCKFRVELCADTLNEFLSYDVLRDRVTVTSSGSHGVICIGACDDPCDLRNLLALESVRIALTVVTLVMEVSAYAEVRELVDLGEDAVTLFRVLLDDVEFFVGELAGLVDNGVRDADFSYVVEKGSEVDLLAFFVVLACELCDLNGILGNSGGVTIRIRVFGVDHLSVRFDEFLKELLLSFILFCFNVEIVGTACICSNDHTDKSDEAKEDDADYQYPDSECINVTVDTVE